MNQLGTLPPLAFATRARTASLFVSTLGKSYWRILLARTQPGQENESQEFFTKCTAPAEK